MPGRRSVCISDASGAARASAAGKHIFLMSEVESKILARELGKFGGVGAKWVARFLPSISFETTFDIPASSEDALQVGVSVLREIGRADPDLPELSVICGSGHLNLNPTIVSLEIALLETGARVSVRGIAKEGLVKQDSARKAVEKVRELLQRRYA